MAGKAKLLPVIIPAFVDQDDARSQSKLLFDSQNVTCKALQHILQRQHSLPSYSYSAVEEHVAIQGLGKDEDVIANANIRKHELSTLNTQLSYSQFSYHWLNVYVCISFVCSQGTRMVIRYSDMKTWWHGSLYQS